MDCKDSFPAFASSPDFRAAIFDLDGTLLDSMDIWKKIDIDFLKKRGLKVPDNYVAEMCAKSFADAAKYTVDFFRLDEAPADIVDEWNKMAAFEYAHTVRMHPYAYDYLMRLKNLNIKLAVATALPPQLYIPCLKNNKIFEIFDAHCSTDEVGCGKQKPDVFLLAAAKMQVSASQCIVFDDVLPAIKSAKQAGMLVFGVYDKYSAHHKDEIKAIADGYLQNFADAPVPIKNASVPIKKD